MTTPCERDQHAKTVRNFIRDPEGFSSPINRALARAMRNLYVGGLDTEYIYDALLASADPS